MQDRILVLATHGRDADVLQGLLARAGHQYHRCPSPEYVAHRLAEGAAAAVVTEESFVGAELTLLLDTLQRQPPWSDFPFIMLSTKRAGRRPAEAQALLDRLGNVVVLERPIHADTLTSAVASALRGRQRQYQARGQIEAVQAAEVAVTDLNAVLEARVAERTDALAAANNRLTQEIAERERAQSALAQAQKMDAVGQLTGGIAHDFNNLLSVIVGNLDLIERRTEDAKVARLVGLAQQATARATRLTQQLLVFARAQRLHLEPVDLARLLPGMEDLLVRTIGKQVTFAIEVGDRPLWATADANQLELAVLNLVINARDAMPDGGAVRIAAAAGPDDGVRIEVSDTGTGIAAHLVDKVFDPFFTTKGPGKGTGLGLSQVYAIVQQSGGDVSVESIPGAGTTFTIVLRAAAEPAAAAADVPRNVPATPREGHVLVIDDDDGVRQFIADALSGNGYRVTAASNGPAGLAEFARDPPDVVIVDFAMPGMNGVEVVSRLRAAAPDLPVVMVTGYADMDAVDTVVAPEHLLRKPFRAVDLEATVDTVLASRTH